MNYEEAILKGDVLEELLSAYPNRLVGVNLRGTPQYQAWHRDCYQLRREVLHRGHRESTEQQAKQAFESTVNLMNSIASTMPM